MLLFTEGETVRAYKDIDYLPYAYIKEGEVGRVVGYTALGVVVRWVKTFTGLTRWQNTTVLAPTEDTIELLDPTKAAPGTRGILDAAANTLAA